MNTKILIAPQYCEKFWLGFTGSVEFITFKLLDGLIFLDISAFGGIRIIREFETNIFDDCSEYSNKT